MSDQPSGPEEDLLEAIERAWWIPPSIRKAFRFEWDRGNDQGAVAILSVYVLALSILILTVLSHLPVDADAPHSHPPSLSRFAGKSG